MNAEKQTLYEKYGLKAEMMEYNQLLIEVIKKVRHPLVYADLTGIHNFDFAGIGLSHCLS